MVGRGALLTLPDATRFTFEAGGLPVELEESIYFAAPEGPKACWQIVVHGRAAETPQITWTLTRVVEPSASANSAESELAPGPTRSEAYDDFVTAQPIGAKRRIPKRADPC